MHVFCRITVLPLVDLAKTASAYAIFLGVELLWVRGLIDLVVVAVSHDGRL